MDARNGNCGFGAIVVKTYACGVGFGAGLTRYVEVASVRRQCMSAKVAEDDIVEICDEISFLRM